MTLVVGAGFKSFPRCSGLGTNVVLERFILLLFRNRHHSKRGKKGLSSTFVILLVLRAA